MQAEPLMAMGDIPDGQARELILEGPPPVFLMLIRRGDVVHGYHNVCPHAGRALNFGPDRFLFTPEGRLVCAAHGAAFEVDSGECVMGPCLGASLKPFPVRVEDGQVWARQDDGESPD